jgi:ATP-dependent DNA ligase
MTSAEAVRSRLLIPRSFGRAEAFSWIEPKLLAIPAAVRIKRLPVRFVIPAQPVLAPKPPSGAARVHEIKHDGHRIIVCRDGPAVRLYSRNAYDWTLRPARIAAAAGVIEAKSFTIDGEAVVLGA